jgi:hypothetical protein
MKKILEIIDLHSGPGNSKVHRVTSSWNDAVVGLMPNVPD